MPSKITEHANSAVNELVKLDTDDLYAQLGQRLQAMGTDASISASFAPELPQMMGPLDDLQAFGKLFFRRVSEEAHAVICGDAATNAKLRQQVLDAIANGSAGLAGLLTVALVSQLGLAPAVAGVVAALILKLFLRPAYDAMCSAWKDSLAQSAIQPAAPGS